MKISPNLVPFHFQSSGISTRFVSFVEPELTCNVGGRRRKIFVAKREKGLVNSVLGTPLRFRKE